jgi:hypothetical protein
VTKSLCKWLGHRMPLTSTERVFGANMGLCPRCQQRIAIQYEVGFKPAAQRMAKMIVPILVLGGLLVVMILTYVDCWVTSHFSFQQIVVCNQCLLCDQNDPRWREN